MRKRLQVDIGAATVTLMVLAGGTVLADPGNTGKSRRHAQCLEVGLSVAAVPLFCTPEQCYLDAQLAELRVQSNCPEREIFADMIVEMDNRILREERIEGVDGAVLQVILEKELLAGARQVCGLVFGEARTGRGRSQDIYSIECHRLPGPVESPPLDRPAVEAGGALQPRP